MTTTDPFVDTPVTPEPATKNQLLATDPRLFSAGTEAAEHGKRDILNPSNEAKKAAARLICEYERGWSGHE
jgi:hypothetical protein